ncbi:hypothetical protein M426DRAFT_14909 [Hypoxylon sp. CI-4A]|nr:hypothetical protein M426DRAFT_14909 [Hypoxylon sp. CI-4A]
MSGIKSTTAAAAACELLATQAMSHFPTTRNIWKLQRSNRALKIVRETGTKLAIRGGGRGFNPGFAGTDHHGIVIDLRDLRTLDLDDDGILRVGAGNTWEDVYAFLDKRGLSAIGGRQRDVGVSGFLLGGGMPPFPNLHGLGADNVNNYETYPISTQSTLLVYNPAGFEEVLDATLQAQEAMKTDTKIGMFTNVDPTFIAVSLFYADSEVARPRVLETFFNLKSPVQVAAPTTKGRVKTLVDIIGLVAPPTSLHGDDEDLACLIGEDKGENILGLEKVAQTWWSLVAEWPGGEEDDVSARRLDAFQKGIERPAKKHAAHLDFLFMNDPMSTQDVLRSYGEDNFRTLRDTVAKYDPEGVFQWSQNYGFLVRKSTS